MESHIKPKKRNYKVVRAIETYRAARRNEVRGTDQPHLVHGSFRPKTLRASFVSKPQSKYMPHDNGKKWHPTPIKMKKPLLVDPTTGLPYVGISLSARERFNNRKRKNTKHRTWKKRRSSGLH